MIETTRMETASTRTSKLLLQEIQMRFGHIIRLHGTGRNPGFPEELEHELLDLADAIFIARSTGDLERLEALSNEVTARLDDVQALKELEGVPPAPCEE